VLRLMTLRSDDQFNTTVYTLDDRFRGVFGTRRVLFMNPADIERLGLKVGDLVTATSVANDGVTRAVTALRVTTYDIPKGCAAATTRVQPAHSLWHHAEGSFVPAAKAIPIRVHVSHDGQRPACR